jgi:hypothetical protein
MRAENAYLPQWSDGIRWPCKVAPHRESPRLRAPRWWFRHSGPPTPGLILEIKGWQESGWPDQTGVRVPSLRGTELYHELILQIVVLVGLTRSFHSFCLSACSQDPKPFLLCQVKPYVVSHVPYQTSTLNLIFSKNLPNPPASIK